MPSASYALWSRTWEADGADHQRCASLHLPRYGRHAQVHRRSVISGAAAARHIAVVGSPVRLRWPRPLEGQDPLLGPYRLRAVVQATRAPPLSLAGSVGPARLLAGRTERLARRHRDSGASAPPDERAEVRRSRTRCASISLSPHTFQGSLSAQRRAARSGVDSSPQASPPL